MAKSKKFPDMSIYEASDFWDEHEFDEFGDIEEVSDIQFALKKKKYVGIDPQLYSRIEALAEQLHTTEDALINQWSTEQAEAILDQMRGITQIKAAEKYGISQSAFSQRFIDAGGYAIRKLYYRYETIILRAMKNQNIYK